MVAKDGRKVSRTLVDGKLVRRKALSRLGSSKEWVGAEDFKLI